MPKFTDLIAAAWGDLSRDRDELLKVLKQTKAALNVALHYVDENVTLAPGTQRWKERAEELAGCRIALDDAVDALDSRAPAGPAVRPVDATAEPTPAPYQFGAWPTGTPDPQCPSRTVASTGTSVRCRYWRGHAGAHGVGDIGRAGRVAWADPPTGTRAHPRPDLLAPGEVISAEDFGGLEAALASRYDDNPAPDHTDEGAPDVH